MQRHSPGQEGAARFRPTASSLAPQTSRSASREGSSPEAKRRLRRRLLLRRRRALERPSHEPGREASREAPSQPNSVLHRSRANRRFRRVDWRERLLRARLPASEREAPSRCAGCEEGESCKGGETDGGRDEERELRLESRWDGCMESVAAEGRGGVQSAEEFSRGGADETTPLPWPAALSKRGDPNCLRKTFKKLLRGGRSSLRSRSQAQRE